MSDNRKKFMGELNLVKRELVLPPELGLSGKGIHWTLRRGTLDIFERGYHNPTSIVDENNVLKILFRQPFKTKLGLSYGRKYPVEFTKETGQILTKKVRIFKGTIVQ